jgi:hypothetical protein
MIRTFNSENRIKLRVRDITDTCGGSHRKCTVSAQTWWCAIRICDPKFELLCLKPNRPIPSEDGPVNFRFDTTMFTEPTILNSPIQGRLHGMTQCRLGVGHIDIFCPRITLRDEGYACTSVG